MPDTVTRPTVDLPLVTLAQARARELAELGASPTPDGWLVLAGEQLKEIAAAAIDHQVIGDGETRRRLRSAWARLGAQAAEAIAALDRDASE